MASRNERHVVHDSQGGWAVKAPGMERPNAHAQTKDEAIDKAREILQNSGGGELVIHGMDGKIQESDTITPAPGTAGRRQPQGR